MSVKEKVLAALNSMGVGASDIIVVGFSGGADSVTLLHVLKSLESSKRIAGVAAVHVNHRIRGEEAERDCRFAENFCKERDIPFYAYTYDVAALAEQTGSGLEEMGRQVRYEAFSKVSALYKPSFIATAHTMDDNSETLIFHLCRGCGITGLTGIPMMRGNVIRPLLSCSRTEIESYCYENGLLFVTDSTNQDLTYARNRIRHQVLPQLRLINSAADGAFSRLMKQMQEADDFLSHEAERCWGQILTKESDVYLKEPLLSVHPFLQSFLLKKMLKTFGASCDEQHLMQMRECLMTQGTISLPNGCRFIVSENHVRFLSNEKLDFSPKTLSEGEVVRFFDGFCRFSVISKEEYEQKLKISKFVFKNACDYDMINGVVVLRSRQDGDAYRPVGRGCKKTLKKMFNESAVFPEKRNQIPVLCDKNGIVIVYGFGCDERVKITGATKRVLLLEKVGE